MGLGSGLGLGQGLGLDPNLVQCAVAEGERRAGVDAERMDGAGGLDEGGLRARAPQARRVDLPRLRLGSYPRQVGLGSEVRVRVRG